ncbi:WXG100 family type VII secretion target [Actinomycetospora cinnamomea]|uniref:Uncharacterized protein n=1 Tax=Actinomycetospora cinnamomea TaxID=663609 RepID=A0A2U1F0W4_9PSEU|nr:hypothetical protein [Actinomycetospora cinnamomea]PVZ05769.1 hypothetical protein C8D89_11423 [Actinomycetospora cinnamomea]
MLLAGDPEAMLAAAEQLAGAGRALRVVGEDLAAHGRSITTDWSGPAAPLALARIGGDAEQVRRAAEAVTGVAGPLRACADELRAAQRDFALGEQQRARAVADGQALMEAAAERALLANEATARAFRTAADALDGAAPATAPRGGGGSGIAEAGNIAASLGNAALQHPASALSVVGGATLAGVSALGVAGGTAATATGVGAPVGVPVGGASLAGLAAGLGLAGAGAVDLTHHALGDDRVTPFQVNEDSGSGAAAPPFEAPSEITGMTRHGAERAEGRDRHGVSDEAMADAVANPMKAPEYRPNGTYRYEGQDAVVSLNERGEVVTTWAKTSNGWRHR